MILIDETYFIGELSLPMLPVRVCVNNDDDNDEEEDSEREWKNVIQTVKENELETFVDEYVPKYLIKLFGIQFTQTFLEEISKENPDKIWVNLKNQLLLKFGSYKASPLACYVYYWLMRDARSTTTIVGEAQPKFDNANNANIGIKLIKAWNNMTNMTKNVVNYVFCLHYSDYEPYLKDCKCVDHVDLTTKINAFNL
jgi:hypothetical protein